MTAPGDRRLLEAIALAVDGMPAGHIESLAAAVLDADLFSSDSVARGVAAVASPNYRYRVQAFFTAWKEVPEVSGYTIALALRAAAIARETAHAEQSLEIVWTGPSTQAVPVRRTREVLLELIRLAGARLTVVSFAAYRVPEVLAALGDAALRGVDVRLILEANEESQGRLTRDAAAAFMALGKSVTFYVWPGDKRISGEGVSGILHAKAVIADATAGFVTSANLTGHALAANMELGLLVKGGTVPARLDAHFDELIAQTVLRKVT